MICNDCETVVHCTKHGCIPKQPVPIKPIVDPDLDVNQRLAFKLGWKSAEEAHGITKKGQP